MSINHLGKFLFPRLHPSQYNHHFKVAAATLLSGLIVAGGLAAVMIWRGAVSQ